MYRVGLAGAAALALGICLLALPSQAEARNGFRPAHAGFVLTVGHIAHLKAVLRLTPEQEKLWPPVETALREVVREQASQAPRFELASAVAMPGSADEGAKRALVAALPLIAALDEQQKKSVLRLARSLGLGSLASVF